MNLLRVERPSTPPSLQSVVMAVVTFGVVGYVAVVVLEAQSEYVERCGSGCRLGAPLELPGLMEVGAVAAIFVVAGLAVWRLPPPR